MPALVSLPNPGSQGQPKFLLGADAALVEKWINAEDRPGFGVYDIPNPLRPGATRHGKDSIAAIEVLFFDVDLKDIVETPDQAERALANLVLTPSEVVHSGHGYHVKYRLKEPIDADDDPELFERACALQAQLIEYFCADPAVRPWSLLRRPGTTNTKSTPPVPCRVISAGPTVDLTDIEELASLVAGTALFTRKQINGHAAAAERDGPTDVDARLAAMRHGDEVHGVNATHCAVIPALIWRGVHPADIVERVVDATMEMAARVGLNWSREEEIVTVRRRYLSSLRNLFLKDYDHTTGVIPSWLPGEFHDAWAKVLQASRRPDIGYNPQGFHVKGWATRDSTGAQKAGARAHTAEERLGEGETKADRERKSGSGPGAPRVFALRPFIPFDPAMLPPRQWLYGKHYQRATVGATIAPGGVGKSSTNLVEAIAMATCRNLLGEQPEERLRVWFHNGDDPFDEVQRRVAAICTHYAIDQEELADWLWITTAEDFPLRVAEGYSNLAINDALVRQINAVVGDTRIDVCILDPLVKLHGVEERDNGRMNRVIEVFASIATEHDCAVELVHHMRKHPAGVNGGEYTVDDARGATAIIDAVRTARIFNRMGREDAEATGSTEVERMSRFRIDRAKGNYSVPGKDTAWRQFVTVALPNGDSVGVITAWACPGEGGAPSPEKDKAEQAADAMFVQLLVRLALEGRAVSDRSGRNFAPLVFAKEPEAKAARIGKAALEDAMRRLFFTGRIRAEATGTGGKRGHRITLV